MQYGIIIAAGDSNDFVAHAEAAEAAGWDAIFTFETVWGVDAWVTLTAAAMRTSRIRLGTMLTPVPRWRPWDLAKVTASLDNVSGGRVILGTGMGALTPNWIAFEPDEGRRVRAEKFDEGLDVLFGLWQGQPFSYEGKHFRAQPTDLHVPNPPVQQPRIPTWCVGLSGSRKSMARAARCDGLLPNFPGIGPEGGETFQQWVDVVGEITALRQELGYTSDYDVVYETTTALADRAAAIAHAQEVADAGITWYLDSDWMAQPDDPFAYQAQRIQAGPPR